jgi:predicted MPP superfamily phosphohydrolase
MLKLLIYQASWLVFLALPLALFIAFRTRGLMRWLAALAVLGASLFAYARYIEPRLLTVHRETILLPGATADSPSIRIALFADTHIGIFKNAMPVNRIVARINREAPDAVFLAGDLTYHPKPEEVAEDFAALGDLKAPLYAVFGNHDVGFPGDDLTAALMPALASANARILHNRAETVEIGGQRITVSGASDLWQRQQNFDFRTALPEGVPVILLTHNPDTALNVPNDFPYDLMLAGHTHGGQVRLPFIVQSYIPTDWDFDKELHHVPALSGERLVYVTSGTGMVGLPLRFNMPPRIDILTVHVPERKQD